MSSFGKIASLLRKLGRAIALLERFAVKFVSAAQCVAVIYAGRAAAVAAKRRALDHRYKSVISCA